jgi:hypothetical protein
MNLRVSAGLGRLDLIDGFFSAGGDLLPRAGAARGYVAPHAGFPEATPGNSKEEILADALVYAAVSGRLEAVDLLLDRGADPNATPYQETALFAAVRQGRGDVAHRFLEEAAGGNR